MSGPAAPRRTAAEAHIVQRAAHEADTQESGGGRAVPLHVMDLGLGSTLLYVPVSFPGQPQGLLDSDVLRHSGAVTVYYAGQRLPLPGRR